MHEPSGRYSSMDYDAYAPTYASSRWALPWVLEPLRILRDELPPGASILELGCGTANYLWSLADGRRDLRTIGLDLSEPMLREARRLGRGLPFVRGDAASAIPFEDRSFALVFSVDVLQHIERLSEYFREAHRVLQPGARLVLVTDSAATLQRRALTRFFPEILPIELARYPPLSEVLFEAENAGLRLESQTEVAGEITLDERFVRSLEAKCSSAMRLISEEAHRVGVARVRAARAAGESWLSCNEVLRFARPA